MKGGSLSSFEMSKREYPVKASPPIGPPWADPARPGGRAGGAGLRG
jgi:hypothetical protein